MTDHFRRSDLPGGLRVVTEHVAGVRSAAVGLWIGVGSRDETPHQAGAAHFLEHLLFKATGRRSAARIAEEIDAVGGELNAFTGKEKTCFFAHVLDTDLALAIDLVTDVVLDAQCTDADTTTERLVVLDEIAMRDDDPEELLGDLFGAASFGDHPLGRSILGSTESITAMAPDVLRGFYREHYRLPRMVLAVAGNIDHDEVLRLVDKALAGLGDGHSAAEPVPPRGGPPVPLPAPRLLRCHDDSEQANLMLGLPGVDRHDDRLFAAHVLATALGGGMSSRLFQQVREERGLAYQVYAAVDTFADAGQLTVYAGCQPDNLAAVTSVIRQVLADLAAGGVSDAELSRAKGQLRGGLVLGTEDTAAVMSRLGRHALDYGRYTTLDETIARIETVTSQQVTDLAARILPGVTSAAVVGPYAHDDDLPDELREVIG